MTRVNVQEAQTRLSELLRRVQTGERVLICKDGEPIADLIPHRRGDRLTVDPFLSQVVAEGDLTAPFTEGDWEDSE